MTNPPTRTSSLDWCEVLADGEHYWSTVLPGLGNGIAYRRCMSCRYVDVSELAGRIAELEAHPAMLLDPGAEARGYDRAIANLRAASSGAFDVLSDNGWFERAADHLEATKEAEVTTCACGAALVGCPGCGEQRCPTCDPVVSADVAPSLAETGSKLGGQEAESHVEAQSESVRDGEDPVPGRDRGEAGTGNDTQAQGGRQGGVPGVPLPDVSRVAPDVEAVADPAWLDSAAVEAAARKLCNLFRPNGGGGRDRGGQLLWRVRRDRVAAQAGRGQAAHPADPATCAVCRSERVQGAA